MKTTRSLLILVSIFQVACQSTPVTTPTPEPSTQPDIGILWATHSAEYQAISAQTYAQARRDLPRLLADRTFSAVPGQINVEGKPPAIILDVDETIVSNVGFQASLKGDYTSLKHYLWSKNTTSIPVRGAAETIIAAREAGVEASLLSGVRSRGAVQRRGPSAAPASRRPRRRGQESRPRKATRPRRWPSWPPDGDTALCGSGRAGARAPALHPQL